MKTHFVPYFGAVVRGDWVTLWKASGFPRGPRAASPVLPSLQARIGWSFPAAFVLPIRSKNDSMGKKVFLSLEFVLAALCEKARALVFV